MGESFLRHIVQTVFTNCSALLREYQDVTSIHVYSLSPRPQTDVALLADIASSTSDIYRQNGPILATNKYGVITNPSVRRRDPAARHAPSAVGAPKPVKQEKVAEKPAPAPKVKQEVVEKSSANPTPSSSSGKGPAPVAKRGGAGGIMQSFAKAASKPPPKPKQPVKKEDTSVAALSDDGEADDADMPSSRKAYTAAPDAARKSKKEREENLRRMMDEDDDDDVDEKDDEPDDEEMDDAPEPEPEPEPEAKPKEEPAEVISSSENGRRRGKRRIMKKKRILDDQGYMGKSNRLPAGHHPGQPQAFGSIALQSPSKSPAGNLFQKMILRFRLPRRLPPQLRRRPVPRPRSLVERRTRGISCHSSQRNKNTLMRAGRGRARSETIGSTGAMFCEAHLLASTSKPFCEPAAPSS